MTSPFFPNLFLARSVLRAVTVRSRTGRNRYIAFRVYAPRGLSRSEVETAIRQLPARPSLVQFDGARGLVRCRHTERDAVRDELNALGQIGGVSARVETVGTSGTIAAARRKFLP